ncbi:MAG: methionine aminotransferase [Pseudomonadota bacterium]
MSITVRSKLPDVGTTIFSVMSALATKSNALNLSQGFPDFEPPESLAARLNFHVENGHNQYPPMHGVAVLREAIAHKMHQRYGLKLDAELEVTVTSGATEALFSSIAALCGPGDEVIVFDPAYDSYDPAIRLAGALPVHVPLLADNFGIDFAALSDALTSRTRMLVINTPHNPTATVVDNESLGKLAALLEPLDCVVLSDEVYEHIVFDGARHQSLVAHPQLKDRTIAVFSFGKTYHATGWKIGYAIAPRELTTEIRKVHQFNTFATAGPMQWALADFMREDPGFAESIGEFYQAKRDLFAGALSTSRLQLGNSAGTYFQLAEYSGVSDMADTEFCRWLTTDIGVAAIPVSVFSEKPMAGRWIRFCFAKQDETLLNAAEILCKTFS